METQDEQIQDEGTVELGGHINLTGFRDVDPGTMVVVKKIVGTYAKKFSEQNEGFESLGVTLKTVHKTEGSEKYELHGKLIISGKPITAEITERNMFFALDALMKKVENSLG